jgi:uncharacterized protein
MKVLVTGATGLVGRAICKKLHDRQDKIFIISRERDKAEKSMIVPCEVIEGDLSRSALDLPDVDAVIHLMGESVMGRWNEDKKKRIYNSRVESTRNLRTSLKGQMVHLLSASAVGYYPSSDEIMTEKSGPGEDFLAKVCIDWEIEVKKTAMNHTIFRISPVMAKEGGALEKMLPPFKMGIGGPLASGAQWMSWIHIEDLSAAFVWALETKKFGIYNAAAPENLRNLDFTKVLCDTLGKRMGPKVPKFALKLMFGEATDALLASSRVKPDHLQREGFRFKFPILKAALEDLLKT